MDDCAPETPSLRDPYGRAKIGVKFSGEAPRKAMPLRDSLFMTYVEDLRLARQDYQGAIRFAQKNIARWETGDPDAMLHEAQSSYGSSTTVASAIEREWTTIAEAWAMLEELEVTPAAYEEDLWRVLSNPFLDDDRPQYNKALTSFVSAYGDREPIHTQFLVARAAMEAEIDLFHGQDMDEHWDGARWRNGGEPVKMSVDPTNLAVDHTLIDRNKSPENGEQVTEQSLYAAMKVSAIVCFHEQEGNEALRAHWRCWLDRELSTLSQLFEVDFQLDVDESKAPTAKTVQRWESEINVLDSEDQAKLRHWEAVALFWYSAGDGDADPEEAKWAEHVENEAEESRRWAQEKRNNFLHGRTTAIGRVKRRRWRAGPRARRPRGRAFRRCGSRRVSSRSAGGGSSGDDPDPEPLARTGAYGLVESRLVLDIAVTSFGMQIGEGFMGLEGKFVGGAVAYLWCCWRWHRRPASMRRG